jgi:hypothetical protein
LATHEIRLRGGWECRPAGAPGRGPMRLTVPAPADSLPAGRLRLTRWFNRPPRAAGEPATLRLSACPGIHAVTHNGRPIGPISPDRADSDLPLGPLEPRNELAIEADPPLIADQWGLASLIFVS